MATPSGNLQELTVTCSQCGSASMERLGPREYRCNHCGAITVVSADQADQADRAAAQSGSPAGSQVAGRPLPSDPPAAYSGQGTQAPASGSISWWKVGVPLVLLVGAIVAYNTSGSSSTSSVVPATPTVPVSQLIVSPMQWSNTAGTGVSSGRYTGLIMNRSAWPVEVPRYSMTLYVRGVQGATAYSDVPVPRLMPGEYEPISFAFETPADDARTEITPPDAVNRASAGLPGNAGLSLSKQQLIREAGKPGYRMVGVVSDTGGRPIKTSEVMVMLFGAGHTLLGYGRGYTRALRAGEQAAIEIPIPTSNVNPVVSYEYLIDASMDSSQ